MKVFLVVPASHNGEYVYESLRPVGDVDWLDFWRFKCVPKAHEWDVQRAVVASREASEAAGDFPFLTAGCLVLSAKALVPLGPTLSNCGELLPLFCSDGRSFTLCNPYPCYDFLDQERSEGKRFSDNKRWMFIEQFELRRDAIPTKAVFKLADDKTKVFCSSDFKKAVEDTGLIGLRFREIWNDDGDAVEIIRFLDFMD